MKEYRATLTINVFIRAEDEADAQMKFEDMEYSFTDPDDHDELQSELIDWDITEIGNVEDDDPFATDLDD